MDKEVIDSHITDLNNHLAWKVAVAELPVVLIDGSTDENAYALQKIQGILPVFLINEPAHTDNYALLVDSASNRAHVLDAIKRSDKIALILCSYEFLKFLSSNKVSIGPVFSVSSMRKQ